MTMLRKKRTERGLTQHELSVMTGIPACTISRYEQGKTEPSLPTARKLSDALHCIVDVLFPGTTDPEGSERKDNEFTGND